MLKYTLWLLRLYIHTHVGINIYTEGYTWKKLKGKTAIYLRGFLFPWCHSNCTRWLRATLILVIRLFEAFYCGRHGIFVTHSTISQVGLRESSCWDGEPTSKTALLTWRRQAKTQRLLLGSLLLPRQRGAGPGVARLIKPTHKVTETPHHPIMPLVPASLLFSFTRSISHEIPSGYF